MKSIVVSLPINKFTIKAFSCELISSIDRTFGTEYSKQIKHASTYHLVLCIEDFAKHRTPEPIVIFSSFSFELSDERRRDDLVDFFRYLQEHTGWTFVLSVHCLFTRMPNLQRLREYVAMQRQDKLAIYTLEFRHSAVFVLGGWLVRCHNINMKRMG